MAKLRRKSASKKHLQGKKRPQQKPKTPRQFWASRWGRMVGIIGIIMIIGLIYLFKGVPRNSNNLEIRYKSYPRLMKHPEKGTGN